MSQRAKLWYDPEDHELTFTYLKDHKFVAAVYCTHDGMHVRNGWLYVDRTINGESSGYYELSPALALLAAQDQKHGLFLGPQHPCIDFHNDVTTVHELPLQPNDETRKVIRDAQHGIGLLGPYKDCEEMFRAFDLSDQQLDIASKF